MAINITYIKNAFDTYDFFKASINIGNHYTDGYFSIIMVLCVFILALYTQKENNVEIAKALSVSCLLSFIFALLLMAFGEIQTFIVTIIGILTAGIVLYQKKSEN